MSEIYKSVITNLGLSLLANAQVTGNKVNITHMAFGDSNGSYYEPNPNATSLRNERCRVAITNYYKNPKNNSMLTIDAVLTSDVPPAFTIREIALFDNTGNMIVVGKVPSTDKVDPSSSAATDLYFKLNIQMSHAANISITIDPLTSLATTGYVDSKVSEIVSVEVVDDLITNDAEKALSAKQGKKIYDEFTQHKEQNNTSAHTIDNIDGLRDVLTNVSTKSVSGTYTGNGVVRTINLGFKPKLVIIYGNYTENGLGVTFITETLSIIIFNGAVYNHYAVMYPSDDGFVVGDGSAVFNFAGKPQLYTAFK